jgi:hypothetical protein
LSNRFSACFISFREDSVKKLNISHTTSNVTCVSLIIAPFTGRYQQQKVFLVSAGPPALTPSPMFSSHGGLKSLHSGPPFSMFGPSFLSPNGRSGFGRSPTPTPTPSSPQRMVTGSPSPSGLRSGRPLSSPAKMAKMATTQGQIKCNCGSLFPNIDILERHMLATHPENTNLVS